MGALDGLLVVALEQAVAGPLCTQRLADAGARVIKIERAGGETARHYDASVQGVSAYFAWLNRGKQSAVLDLKAPADKAVFEAMLAQADVFVQNLAPGAMARLGLGPEVLRARFPKLIAVSITGYGQDTGYAQMKAYDMLVQAEAGVCAVTGTPDVPSKVGVSAADIATGSNAHAAVLEALIARGTTGQGCAIEIAMFDGLADWMTVPLLHHSQGGKTTGRHGLTHASIYPYGAFAGSDGAIVLAVQTNGQWAAFCEDVLARPDLVADPRFASNPMRVANRAALDAVILPLLATQSVAALQQKCQEAGLAWGRYRDVAGVADHPALRTMAVTLPDGACVDLPRPAGREARHDAGPVPALGADTEKVRAEFGAAAHPPEE